MRPKIGVIVRGGLVQEVKGINAESVDLYVIDYDTDGDDDTCTVHHPVVGDGEAFVSKFPILKDNGELESAILSIKSRTGTICVESNGVTHVFDFTYPLGKISDHTVKAKIINHKGEVESIWVVLGKEAYPPYKNDDDSSKLYLCVLENFSIYGYPWGMFIPIRMCGDEMPVCDMRTLDIDLGDMPMCKEIFEDSIDDVIENRIIGGKTEVGLHAIKHFSEILGEDHPGVKKMVDTFIIVEYEVASYCPIQAKKQPRKNHLAKDSSRTLCGKTINHLWIWRGCIMPEELDGYICPECRRKAYARQDKI
ncbi:MAG: hypothetical protein SVK08_00045 [Halobacteriota archaeon]|nr:hypothetical protein [Halobacteriota archaeon]